MALWDIYLCSDWPQWLVCFTSLCDWFRKLAPSPQPIKCNTKTNRNSVTRIFPRLLPVFTLSSHWSIMILTFVLNGSCESFDFSPLNWKLHYQQIALPDDDFLVDLVYPGTNEFWSKCCQKKKKSLIKLQGQLRYLNGKFSDNLKVPKRDNQTISMK